MKRLVLNLLCVVGVSVLGACGDRVQTIGVSASKYVDGNSWDVSSKDPYVAPGWTPGDKASWEDHLRRRTQGQNDYAPR